MQAIDTTQVRKLLSQLQKSRHAVFGSDQHGFRLNDPLSEGEVVEFEHRYEVSLPSDYRHFIREVGNGGAGPFYGVFPLGFVDQNFGIRRWAECDGLVGDLSQPFSLAAAWNDLSEMPPNELQERDEDEYEGRMESFENSYWASSLVNGAIPICHEGCALRIYLVVTGPEAGHLWEDRRSEYEGIKPMHTDSGWSLTFSRWYQRWLDGCADAAGL